MSVARLMQAQAMISGTSAVPPQLDEFHSAGEAPRPAAKFVRLGWTEADLWPEYP